MTDQMGLRLQALINEYVLVVVYIIVNGAFSETFFSDPVDIFFPNSSVVKCNQAPTLA